jgi:DHA1 family tetracycline resistance protein-like MFS transporter
MRSITFVIGPILFSQIFAFFINPKHSFHVPGAPYYLGAALLFAAMTMSTRIRQDASPHAVTPEAAVSLPPEEIAAGAAPIGEGKENV